jgi:aminopeptidase
MEPLSRQGSLKCTSNRTILSLWKLISQYSHYKGATERAQPLAFVGKGITFDSGGISLKPGAVEYILLSNLARRSTNSFRPGDEADAWRHGCVIPRWTWPGFNLFPLSSQIGGAAAVVASALAIAQLQLPINLVVVTPLTENLPGPSATKPGDMYVPKYPEDD